MDGHTGARKAGIVASKWGTPTIFWKLPNPGRERVRDASSRPEHRDEE